MKKKKKGLKHKFLLIVRDEDTLEWKFTYRLSRMNLFVTIGTIAILLVIITIYIIAFTPLREYIPGYADINMDKKVRELTLRADSMEKSLEMKDVYLTNLVKIITGRDDGDTVSKQIQGIKKYDMINYKKSFQDSLFRKEMESSDRYNLLYSDEEASQASPIRNFYFFVPLKGIVTNSFNPSEGHNGIDIVAKKNEAVKAALDGTVLFTGWTIKTGYVIALQHQSNIVSFYKHNSALMKKEGETVRAGEVIAIIGDTGELSTGPHLHFELWYDGRAVNPLDYIRF